MYIYIHIKYKKREKINGIEMFQIFRNFQRVMMKVTCQKRFLIIGAIYYLIMTFCSIWINYNQ